MKTVHYVILAGLAGAAFLFVAVRKGEKAPESDVRPSQVMHSDAPPLSTPVALADPQSLPLTAGEQHDLERVDSLLQSQSELGTRALEALRTWAARDPMACGKWVIAHLVGPSRQRALEELAGEWAKHDPRLAMAFLTNQAGMEGSQAAAANVLAAWARTDPQAAADWLDHHRAAANDDMLQATMCAWGETQPEAMTHWVLSQLDPNRRAALLPGLLMVLPAGPSMSAVLQDLPPGARDASLVAAALSRTPADPAGGRALVGLISDPATKARTAADIAGLPAMASTSSGTDQGQSANIVRPAPAGAAGRQQPLQTVSPGNPPQLGH